MKKTVLIIGAGPAGLTAAYELIKTDEFLPVIIEKLDIPGGLSRTINYKGNRIDIGGHRFFSKSDKVMKWWLKILPLENKTDEHVEINYQNKSRTLKNINSSLPASPDEFMLIRERTSRIYFLKQLFPYPLKLNSDTLKKLGVKRSLHILLSFLKSKILHRRPESTLKDFLINRFGEELYKTFFETYTQKVWGTEAENIPAEWGKQRIKGVSVTAIIKNALKRNNNAVHQKGTETSFIEKFLYPKYGPGQLWEKVAKEIINNGGRILYNHDVTVLNTEGDNIKSIEIIDGDKGQSTIEGDFVISTMPVKDLVNALRPVPEQKIKQIAEGLEYREFITVGLLVKKLKLKDKEGNIIRDNWIYIQENDVKVGRVQIFNNWSPSMVKDQATIWLGLEYFCTKDDDLWCMTEKELLTLAESELIKIGIIENDVVIDGTVIRVEKAYPCYFGAYNEIDLLRNYLEKYKNLFLVGRNGMHRYNNQDHSMLTAMEAVNKIKTGDFDKTSIWEINTEETYNEEN